MVAAEMIKTKSKKQETVRETKNNKTEKNKNFFVVESEYDALYEGEKYSLKGDKHIQANKQTLPNLIKLAELLKHRKNVNSLSYKHKPSHFQTNFISKPDFDRIQLLTFSISPFFHVKLFSLIQNKTSLLLRNISYRLL